MSYLINIGESAGGTFTGVWLLNRPRKTLGRSESARNSAGSRAEPYHNLCIIPVEFETYKAKLLLHNAVRSEIHSPLGFPSN